MPLRHAVLGLILERRGYGYDLAQRLVDRLGPAWQLSPSAVYSALDRLERDGHIVGSLRETGALNPNQLARRPGRVVYDATSAGAEAFGAWLERAPREPEPVRNELQIKIAVAGPSDMSSLLAAIEHEERLTQQLLERTATTVTDGRADMIRSAVRARLEADLTWIRATREKVAENS